MLKGHKMMRVSWRGEAGRGVLRGNQELILHVFHKQHTNLFFQSKYFKVKYTNKIKKWSEK